MPTGPMRQVFLFLSASTQYSCPVQQPHKIQVNSMATGVQQVTEDYEQLKELLELYPKISIVKTEGQPPDSYEIEYNLCGYVKNEEDETIGIGQSHRVRLSLPFGYPHFAPVAKPLTPIFHPDFDPAAIRLTDHWQQNPSLPELVLYIGEMICGNVYNLKDSFNQEAAEWYEGQQDQLPLDTVSVADIEAMDSPLDSLDDALIALGDDDRIPLGLEQEPVAAPLPSVDNAELQHIRDLVKKNKIFAANRLLSELPAGVSFADREGMQLHIGKVFRKVDQLFKTVEQLLSMSRLAEAMELVDEIKTLAADAPGADALKKKIQQAMPAAASAARAPGRAKSTAAASKPSSPVKLASKSLGWPGTLPVKPIVAAILILAVAILTISLYFKDQSSLSQSQARLLQGQELIGQKQFDQALETLEGAKAILSDLTILRFRKTTQEKTIDNLISSSEMQEGLQGRVLYEGEFIPLSVAASLEELAELPARAQALVEQNKIEAALALYRQALKFATDHNLDKQQALFGEAIQSLELRNALDEAEKAEKKNDWDEAAESYRKALNLSDQMMQLSTTGDIASRMAVASFRHELDQSKKAFSQSQWKETVQYLERAQQTLDANPGIVSEKERQEFHQLLVNSRLYFMLSTAREAYQQKKWAQAIDDYQSALKLLTKEA
ncbi:MAG: hypothetical protein FWG62_05400, partial [Proteobacteria bacterium]|nr:hypothetical protein [Pseudomonadota bacterium]